MAERFDFLGVTCATYSEPVAELISNFKEQGHSTLASGLARAMASAVNDLDFISNDKQTILVPVADHPDSTRGFSHTKLLSKKLAASLGISWVSALTMSAKVSDQASLTGEARRLNLVNSMRTKPWFSKERVLVVDDLVTTGSTIREARRALIDADCEVVGFVTFAETLKKSTTRS